MEVRSSVFVVVSDGGGRVDPFSGEVLEISVPTPSVVPQELIGSKKPDRTRKEVGHVSDAR